MSKGLLDAIVGGHHFRFFDSWLRKKAIVSKNTNMPSLVAKETVRALPKHSKQYALATCERVYKKSV